MSTTATFDAPAEPTATARHARRQRAAKPARAAPTPLDPSRREALATNVARGAVEAIAGVRDLEQIARWVSPAVFQSLLARVQHAERARRARRREQRRPELRVLGIVAQHVEAATDAVVVVDLGPRARAVCVRLEAVESKWRATSVVVM